jgi:hypothetical protein
MRTRWRWALAATLLALLGAVGYGAWSASDGPVPYQQTRERAEAYAGPKTVWLADRGDHGSVWDADPAEYERRLGAFLDGVSPRPGARPHVAQGTLAP